MWKMWKIKIYDIQAQWADSLKKVSLILFQNVQRTQRIYFDTFVLRLNKLYNRLPTVEYLLLDTVVVIKCIIRQFQFESVISWLIKLFTS